MVPRLAQVCGAARTGDYNKVFLESLRAAASADPAYTNGWFAEVRCQLRLGRHFLNGERAWRTVPACRSRIHGEGCARLPLPVHAADGGGETSGRSAQLASGDVNAGSRR